MHIGHYISGSAHAALIGWVLFGGVFRSEPEAFVVTGVDIITTEQFDTILAAQRPPAPETELETPVAPEINETAPLLQSEPDPTPTQPEPPTPPVETVPEEVPVIETPPPLPPQPTPETPQDIAPPEPVVTPSAPVQSVRPVAPPVRRVAPEPVATPEPDVQIADVDQSASDPSEAAETQEDAHEETAREEAATEIPTEPQQQSAAPARSVRPKLPTRRPTAQPTQSAQDNSATANTNAADSVNAALAEALAETPTQPSGPPLTRGERDGLRLAVQQCWVVDVGSQAANVTVTVGLSLDRDGKVLGGSLRRISAVGGDETAARAAYEAARRAILRCQKSGYNLPIEKYDHWRDIEITFNPENMRRR